jgi:hypothetical protein
MARAVTVTQTVTGIGGDTAAAIGLPCTAESKAVGGPNYHCARCVGERFVGQQGGVNGSFKTDAAEHERRCGSHSDPADMT